MKDPSANAGDTGSIPGSGNPLVKDLTTHSSIFSWEIPWTEEPGGLQSTGSLRVGQDSATEHAHAAHTGCMLAIIIISKLTKSD